MRLSTLCRLTSFAAAALALTACDAGDVPLDHAEIRVVNETTGALDSATVSFSVLTPAGITPGSEQELRIGALAQGAQSDYVALDGAYTYTFSSAQVYPSTVPGEALPLTPFRDDDDIFESLRLGPGRYTYRLKTEPYTARYLRVEAAEGASGGASIEIRVDNQSAEPFDATSVEFMDANRENRTQVDYGPLAPGAVSDYVEVPVAYPYAPATVVVGDTTLSYRVTDYVGETALTPGRYTIGLTIREATAYRDGTEIVREGDR